MKASYEAEQGTNSLIKTVSPGRIPGSADPDGLQDSAGSELLHRPAGVEPAMADSHLHFRKGSIDDKLSSHLSLFFGMAHPKRGREQS